MVKIIKVERVEEMVLVTTDKYPKHGFGFKIDEIKDKADLKKKVKAKIKEEEAKEAIEAENKEKVKNFKDLEGVEL